MFAAAVVLLHRYFRHLEAGLYVLQVDSWRFW